VLYIQKQYWRSILSDSYIDFITGVHNLYDRYQEDWQHAINAYYGGVEYRDGRYLKAYAVDMNTPSETVNTYETASDGSHIRKYKAKLENVSSSYDAKTGSDTDDGSFYSEKLKNTPYLNYLRLISSEYNSILFKNPPQRELPETPEMVDFIHDVDGSETDLNNFMAEVDLMSFIFGVVWVSCVKPLDSEVPKWNLHTPLDVTNWHYGYNSRGELVLKKIVIKLHEDDTQCVYRMITPETIETVWTSEEDDYVPDVDSPNLEKYEDYYRVVEENELGIIPVVPVYQGMKIYSGVGATPSFDLAQIQRSIYGDMAEIYSVISYGAHGTLVVDETTDNLNDGAIGAEPGSVVRVPAGLGNDAPSYVYDFVAPPLQAITEIRELVEQKITKMAEIAMIRSDELIKASRSGEQLEQYDSKLEAFVRRKAQNLENAEMKLFRLWFEWTNQQMPADFSISYNRQYSKKALEHEIGEINSLLAAYNSYKTEFAPAQQQRQPEVYPTAQQAQARAQELGGTGYHSHEEGDSIVYMPFATHDEYEKATAQTTGAQEDAGFEEEMRDKIRKRLEQLMSSTSTDNGV
jgi:hypothetical protein